MSQSTRPKGQEIIDRLEAGQLPQMVDWFNPSILGMVAIRTLLSSTIGEYADQRPMQEAADGQRDMNRLSQRYDYSKLTDDRRFVLPPEAKHGNPYNTLSDDEKGDDEADKLLKTRQLRKLELVNGGLWVDFIADLGDGFEATYAMAYLLQQRVLPVDGVLNELPVEGVLNGLPAGKMLLFGGDMAYPNATEEEYRTRCLEPYDWASQFRPEPEMQIQEPDRELFFIAGNHDWYDGLAAFSNQFCYEASAVGGWRCRQQRSYFALELPFKWWIWGIDVALGDGLDYSQRRYFEAIAEKRMKDEGHKVIILQHAPDWCHPHPEQKYKALSLICKMAREKAEVCAVIAGDLHHYSRYQSDIGSRVPALDATGKRRPLEELKKVEMQLITSGGGGAFAHPTHDQKHHHRIPEAVAGYGKPGEKRPAERPKIKIPLMPKPTDDIGFTAQKFYPTQRRSRLLALKNLALPFRNFYFALFLGVIYTIFAWVFQIAVADPTVAIKNAQYVNIQMQCVAENPDRPDAVESCADTKKRAFDKKLSDLTTVPASKTAASKTPAKAAQDEVEDRFDKLLDDVDRQGGWLNYLKILSAQFSPDRVLSGMLASPAFFLMVAGLFFGLIKYAEADFGGRFISFLIRLVFGTAHATAHLTVLLATNSLLTIVYNFFADSSNVVVKSGGVILYTILMIAIGGFLGAVVFGIYWVVTSLLFRMHQDSFSALGIPHYKNFLRMKFEENKVTIYPIALDKVPGRFGWKARAEGENGHGPLIEPKKPLKPRLIEGPIVIERPSFVDHK